MNRAEIITRASKIAWYHGGIDLLPDLVTKGQSDPRLTLLPFLNLPEDLSDKSVLDIGAWDGFMSFECESRGASPVVSLDSYVWNRNNWPTGQDGFNLARDCKGSSAIPVVCDVLDISPYNLGTFDIVLFLGVLYHMRHPLLALEKVAAVTYGSLILETHIGLDDGDIPAMRFYKGSELYNDYSNWWGPNIKCVTHMLQDVGFSQIECAAGYYGRAVFHAWK